MRITRPGGCWRPPRTGWRPGKRRRRGPGWAWRHRSWSTCWPGRGPGGWRARACTRPGRCPRPRRCCSTRRGCSSRSRPAWPATPCWTRSWRAESVQAARSVPKLPEARASLPDLLLDGFAAVGERRYADGAALLRRAIAPLAAGQPIPDDALPHLMAVGQAAGLLYDDTARYQMERRWVAELRGRGAIAALLTALGIQLSVQVQEGRFADAEDTLAEGRALAEATGNRAILGAYTWQELWALARQGREAETRQLAARMLREYAGAGQKDRGLGGARRTATAG